MNTQAKAKLKAIIIDLESVYAGELKAVKKHTRAGDSLYAEHAAWCVAGIQEALTLLANRFPADAIGLLRSIVASAPTDDLQPHSTLVQSKVAKGPTGCSEGCNHLEHQ